MPSNLDAHIKRSHIVSFSLLALFSFIEWVICAVLVSSYNSHNDYPSHSIRDRVRFLLFVGLWSFLFSFFYLAGFLTAATSFLFSIASHAVWIGITWVFWLAGAAAITDTLGGGLDCGNFHLAHCHQLNAVEAFGWINWILITFLLAFVLFAGARSARSGNGFGGPLTPAV
ncbi:hypothetical protein NBRC10512_005301 [Rhodotorula toruloides]|uniref:RHTO0S23e00782g1_1 n=2 Tax=Rhodotorula toruloides TaxID=5286 RepID=A0A061BMB6_RHOTO|nr:MARVEL-like domain protein [Rhodotorula toruloides NP11]EMS18472.1 MARVEL-like domain protein [Rhodotorula toruloides NP11]CDR49108.1 RHTO0S23e00782g1_1 [Rhodotorula toruloides]